jgi:hypothetical protein
MQFMPRTEKVLSVFLASPSDVQAERDIVSEVINELNFVWSKQLGLRMELIRWETSVYPGLGSDPQDVVNSQVIPNFDLFVGIMWHRFGTPTQRAASGTYEEFQAAKSRWEKSPSSVDVMFYFKDAPISPNSVDIVQLGQVQEFRKELGVSGLYSSFLSVDDFEKKIRNHLSLRAQKWSDNPIPVLSGTALAPMEESNHGDTVDGIQLDELGMIECHDEIEKHFAIFAEVMEVIKSITKALREKIEDHTQRILRITREHVGNRERFRLALRDVSSDLNAYAESIKSQTSSLAKSADDGLAVMKRLIVLWPSFISDSDVEELRRAEATLQSLDELHGVTTSTRGSMEAFRGNIEETPPWSTDIIKAKARVSGALTEHVDALYNFERELAAREDELRKVIEAQ